ncbi:MAG: GntR family transcriptional regulator [Desulfobacterales bacterium]|nr:GntR family transcriptional regulator [Desulfobacterales bacterium]
MKETVYQTIRERILYLEYTPGQILNEKILAQEFGMSRSPIKDVLNRLEWDQLVRVIPRTGSMVTEIEFSMAMHVYQVRFEIESFEASLAEKQFTAKHRARLKALVESCNKLLKSEDSKGLAKIDTAMREIVHDAAGNPVLADVSDRLYSQTFRLWYSVMAKSDWQEELMAVQRDLENQLAYLESGKTGEMGQLRKEELLDHIERLRSKFLRL